MIIVDLKSLIDTGKNWQKSFNRQFDLKNGTFYYGFPRTKMTEIF
jgi:hypothetical protein